jgi:hypothetical protein
VEPAHAFFWPAGPLTHPRPSYGRRLASRRAGLGAARGEEPFLGCDHRLPVDAPRPAGYVARVANEAILHTFDCPPCRGASFLWRRRGRVRGGPVPRKNETMVTTSGKRLSGRRGTPTNALAPNRAPVPANPCAPHARAGTNFTIRCCIRSYRCAPLLAQAPTNCGNINPSTSPRQTSRSNRPTLGVSFLTWAASYSLRPFFFWPSDLTCSAFVPILQPCGEGQAHEGRQHHRRRNRVGELAHRARAAGNGGVGLMR